ncbi:MAG: tyrosine-protein phosphatase [Pseudomonadales bacterium]|mgnify:FL=1|jgi:uncharacterized protein (TIGR01244 family)|nr:tyrosine-protein phosphatase [Pseudomonadales bacterium]MDP7315671.1 tyrosine-protein phosphatase [Pseudomonadales bacterium]MDP7452294.1 tyrosine-protein phosphatase [Arenicellales bacterium]MDP7576353.1 tyrosine-protein phosphatase [Pseudomonadales bacterium]HJP52761.1 tyrosine-protein phosphatase [Pseudomonadales bacterium]|tara:strand:- start:13431 stop:13949 length:519 start_codon:yes stop_codon:yes gene_type:complete
MNIRVLVTILSASLIALNALAAEQVPFGDAVSAEIKNYHRHRPMIATSGSLGPGALDELKKYGFRTVLDLRTEAEGVKEEAKAVEHAGLVYHNIPVGRQLPDDSAFDRFKEIVEDPDNLPLLIHCGSANRVGQVWAEYQIRRGMDYDTAVIEGRTIGMSRGREKQLVKKHGK